VGIGAWRENEEVAMTRYAYRPYHPWRHGYRRERWKRRILFAARVLLVLECLWFSFGYIKTHTVEKTVLQEETEEELYGIGFGPGEGKLFWFHSYFAP
jgi:hypothetical protein